MQRLRFENCKTGDGESLKSQEDSGEKFAIFYVVSSKVLEWVRKMCFASWMNEKITEKFQKCFVWTNNTIWKPFRVKPFKFLPKISIFIKMGTKSAQLGSEGPQGSEC